MEKLYRFRKYKKKQGKKNVRHPKLIVDDYEHEYGFMGLTSSRYKGRGHKNIELNDNPEIINGKRLEVKSYLRRKVEYDNKRYFGEIVDNYELSKTDKNRIIDYVNKHKKR